MKLPCLCDLRTHGCKIFWPQDTQENNPGCVYKRSPRTNRIVCKENLSSRMLTYIRTVKCGKGSVFEPWTLPRRGKWLGVGLDLNMQVYKLEESVLTYEGGNVAWWIDSWCCSCMPIELYVMIRDVVNVLNVLLNKDVIMRSLLCHVVVLIYGI